MQITGLVELSAMVAHTSTTRASVLVKSVHPEGFPLKMPTNAPRVLLENI